jgi:MEDS: MEthanogen/methylotroph, DcmR Sensory domain/Histidine kinase-like ATPase domain
MATVETQDTVEQGEHIVKFYEHDSELVATVVPYLAAGIRAGDMVVVVATEVHRQAFETELVAGGVDVASARAAGSFLTLDAASTMAAIMVEGQIDRDAFRELAGGLVREPVESGRAFRLFGEIVTLLWDAGEILAAIELEGLWNDLGEELSFSLFCSYPSASLGRPEHHEASRQVCQMHSSVLQAAAGAEQHKLGHASQADLTASFPAERDSPGRARRLAVAELQRWGIAEEVVNDVALVLSELASNAVIHAGSPFFIRVQPRASAIRVAVQDQCPVPDTGGGGMVAHAPHGLAVIQALSTRWGVHDTPDGTGKIVWAELPIA